MLVEKIAKRVPLGESTTVLDFGAGTGLVAFQFLPRVGLVFLLDPSREMLRKFKDDIAKTDFHNFEICAGTLDDFTIEPMDIVVCSLSLHHTPNMADSLNELFNCVKPGGHLFAVEKKGFGGDAIAELMTNAGFTDVTYEDHFDEAEETAETCVNIFLSATRPEQ
jgi:ubiquinone/menaquinone biosynthesis C-methylase UbiE